MPADLPVNASLVIPAAELEITASRASGPGGQHVNTTDSRIQVRWNVATSAVLSDTQRARLQEKLAARLSADGALLVACDTHRSQRRNRDEALARLAALVKQGLQRPRPRRATTMPRAAREERLRQKKQRAQRKRDRRPPEGD